MKPPAWLTIASLCWACIGHAYDSETDRALANSEFTWRSITDGNIRLYYQPDSFAERHRITLLRSVQGALETGLTFLDMVADERELRVVFVDDRSQMEALVGRPFTGYADWTGHGVFLVCSPDWRSFDTHEITHILTLGRWGHPAHDSGWMVEGLPFAVDGWCQTFDVHRIAGYLKETGHWPGLPAFIGGDPALGEIAGGALAASLLRHLQEQYGPDLIEDAWRMGLVPTLESREIDPARVEQEWLDSLGSRPDPMSATDWEKLDTEGCG